MKSQIKQLSILLILFLICALLLPALVHADDWRVGNIVGLCQGTEIREGPGFGYRVHTIVPENDWAVKIIGGPRYADGEEWWDTSRREAGDPSGGTGWVYKRQATACKTPTAVPPTTAPSPANVRLVADLVISNHWPAVGESVNATFRVRNYGGQTFYARYFGVKGRGPGDSDRSFHWIDNFQLGPGQEFTYDANRSFDQAGGHWFTPNYSPDGSNWADITWPDGRTSYVSISVRGAPTAVPPPTTAPPTAAPQIEFSADRTHIQRGECATLTWRVENVREVYLDGEGVAGQGSRRVCPERDTTYTLRVITYNGEEIRQVTITVSEPPTPIPTGSLVVVGGLHLSATDVQVGQTIEASFRVRNDANYTIVIRQMEASARGPDARRLNWNAREVDFPAVTNLTLRPGEEYEYRQSRSFDQPGDYFAEPVYLNEAGKWGGILPYNRVWFTVTARPPTPVSPTRVSPTLPPPTRVSPTPPPTTTPPPPTSYCPGVQALFVFPAQGRLGWIYRDPRSDGTDPNVCPDGQPCHSGIDIWYDSDRTVRAAYGGVVYYRGTASLGLRHEDLGIRTYYAHLSTSLGVGDTVARGQEIGRSDGTNWLHFSVGCAGCSDYGQVGSLNYDPSPYLGMNVDARRGASGNWDRAIGSYCYGAAPAPASLAEPADNAQVRSPVTLRWQAVAGAARYQVQVFRAARDAAGRLVSSSQVELRDVSGVTTQFSLSVGEYLWHVQAVDGQGNGVWGPARRFRVVQPGTTVAMALGQEIGQGEQQAVGTAHVASGQEQLQINLQWPGSTLELLVTDPQGRLVDASYPGARWVREPTRVQLTVSDPLPGDWSLAVVGQDVPEGATTYEVTVITHAAEVETASASWLCWGVLGLCGIALVGLGAGGAALAVTRWRGRESGELRAHEAVGWTPPATPPLPPLGPPPTLPPPTPAARVCPHCGGPLRPTARFCGRCGRTLSPQPLPPGPRPAGVQLRILSGPLEGQLVTVRTSPATIGRAPGHTLVLPDPQASRLHARLTITPQGVWLEDCGSRNGTFVNGQRVTRHLLRRGDRVQVGATIFQIVE